MQIFWFLCMFSCSKGEYKVQPSLHPSSTLSRVLVSDNFSSLAKHTEVLCIVSLSLDLSDIWGRGYGEMERGGKLKWRVTLIGPYRRQLTLWIPHPRLVPLDSIIGKLLSFRGVKFPCFFMCVWGGGGLFLYCDLCICWLRYFSQFYLRI